MIWPPLPTRQLKAVSGERSKHPEGVGHRLMTTWDHDNGVTLMEHMVPLVFYIDMVTVNLTAVTTIECRFLALQRWTAF